MLKKKKKTTRMNLKNVFLCITSWNEEFHLFSGEID